MRTLTATESITPAIERTRHILFSPFRKGRTWKFCATSYACRVGSLYLPFPLLYLAAIPALHEAGPAAIVVIGVIVVIGLALYTWIFHLCSRLQFAYFDMVVNRGEFVAPAWRKYAAQAFPWTVFKILLGTICTALLSVPMIAFMRHLLPVLAQMKPQPHGKMDPQFVHVLLQIYSGYGLLMLLIFGAMLLFGLLGDFILPSLALENTGMREAFRRMGILIQQEPGEFALYVLLKTVLGVVAYMGVMIAWEIAFVLVSLIVALVVFLVGFGLHLVGVPSVLLTAVGLLLAIAWYVFGIYTMVFPLGIVITWMDAYAIYFLGGRYPMLGDMIDRSTPPPPVPVFNTYLPAYPPPAPPTA